MTYSYGDTAPRCWCGQDWILPRKAVIVILAVSLILLLIGVVLLAVGLSVGGVLVGLGGCGLIVLLLLGIHAFCCRYTKEVFTQTGVQVEMTSDDIPNYAVIQKPSSLKRSDSGSKRNGRTLEKHVTLAPDIEARERSGQVTVAPSSGTIHMDGVHQIPIQHSNQSQMYSQQNSFAQQTPIFKPSGQMYVPPAPMNRQASPTFQSVPPANQYPMQVYPMKTASSTSSSIRYGFDDDYDNPAETTPMLSQQKHQFSSGMSSGMTSGMSSGMSGTSGMGTRMSGTSGMSSGMSSGTGSGIGSGMGTGMSGTSGMGTGMSGTSGMGTGMSGASGIGSGMGSGISSDSYSSQFRTSSSQQQTTVISCKGGGQRAEEYDLPEPQPLQYPSAKRPMTFEQTSSSKMSVYDNVGGGGFTEGVA